MFVHRGENRVEIGDHLTDGTVAVGQCGGQLRCLAEDTGHRAALTLEHGDQGGGDVVDLVRVEGLEKRLEAADEGIEVQSRLGTGQRNEAARRQHPISALTRTPIQIDEPVANQVGVANLSPRRLVDRERFVNGKLHQNPLTVLGQRHVADLTDLDSTGADKLPALEPAAVAELRRVSAVALESQLTEHHHQNRGAQGKDHRRDPEFDCRSFDTHGLIVFSPN